MAAGELRAGQEPQAGLRAELEGRAAFLRTLAELYFAPLTQEQVDALDPDALHGLASRTDDPLAAEGYGDMYRALRHRDSGTRQELNVDFTGTFYGVRTYEGLAAEPYASLYTSPEGVLAGPARTSARRALARGGVRVADGVDLPDDHLSFAFEYLALLNDRAAEALDEGDGAGVRAAIEEQRDFLDECVLGWFPRFYNLSNKVLETRFYRGVNKVAKAFLTSEHDELDRLAAMLGEAGEAA